VRRAPMTSTTRRELSYDAYDVEINADLPVVIP
jgi:hypothetical protein